MKATGIVRRIDDLGRIVIPKEIRRTLRIREGDPLEIFTNREEEIVLKKYSPIGELKSIASIYAESLAQTIGELVIITDKDMVVAAAGPKKKDYDGKVLSRELMFFMDARKMVTINRYEKAFVPIMLDENPEFETQTIVTIICNGDSIGSIIIYGSDKKNYSMEELMIFAQVAAQYLGKQME